MTGIFRAYDIRGTYGKDLTENTAFDVGAAFGTINKGTIAVGMDARLSSLSLKEKLIEGLISAGAKVLDFGTVSTPMLTFAVGSRKLDGGVMVTASHNPKDYNGFKMYVKGGMPLSYESGIIKMERLVKDGTFAKGKGTAERTDIFEDYAKFLLRSVKSKGKMKIVVDGGNGVAGKMNAEILRRAGYDVVELFCTPDGNFPNHAPDPSEPENLEDLKGVVEETGADLGLAFDGDGDRLGVVDRGGKEVKANDVFVVLAKQALQGKKGAKIVIDLSSSMAVADCVRAFGGTPIECKVGHTYIAQKMADTDAAFAGELSGHYFFREIFRSDDALYAGLRLLEFLSNGTSLQHETASIPRYFSELGEGNAIAVREEDKPKFMEKIMGFCRKKGYKTSDTDGVKITFEDGWALFRPSNTAPLVRYGFEARTRDGFERIKKTVEEIKGMI